MTTLQQLITPSTAPIWIAAFVAAFVPLGIWRLVVLYRRISQTRTEIQRRFHISKI